MNPFRRALPAEFTNLKRWCCAISSYSSASGVIVLLLFVSLIVVSASLAKERQARRDAQAASVKSQQVTKFLESMLNGVGPSVARGRDTAMLQEILDRTAERVGVEMTNQPAVEAELRALIGKLYEQIGKYRRAEEMERLALALNRKYFGMESRQAATSLNDSGVGVHGPAQAIRSGSSEWGGARHPAADIRRGKCGYGHFDQ